MIEVYQADHRAQGLSELPSYQRQKAIESFVAGFCKIIQHLEDDIYALKVEGLIQNAVGAQLDQYAFLGEKRDGLDDDEYRRLLLASIPAWRSSGKPDELITIGKILLDSEIIGPLYFQLGGPGYSLQFVTEYVPSALARGRIRTVLQRCKPAGITQELILAPPGAFVFGDIDGLDESDGMGFDDGALSSIL